MAKTDETPLKHGNAVRKTIAVDLDDTLNDFTRILRDTDFAYDPGYPFSEETFKSYLHRMRNGIPEDSGLLSTEYSFFQYRISEQCYRLAHARPDGIEFMKWLRKDGWRIVICTTRDLRRANECTVTWLKENDIPFDHLFMAYNKIVFCRLWGIEHLVDDAVFNIVYGERYGVNVYYPLMEKNRSLKCAQSRGFQSFREVKQWLGN